MRSPPSLSIPASPNAIPVPGERLSGLAESATFAAVGGMLDAFMYLDHGHVFANSMTGNVVLLGIDLMSGDWRPALRHLLPILSFGLGIAAARACYRPRVAVLVRDADAAVLAAEVLLLGLLGCLPPSTSDYVLTIGVAFAASLQTEVFRTVQGSSYNSTFTTGNLRSLAENLFGWLIEHKASAHTKVHTFATICGIFLLGALSGAFLATRLHNRTLWVVCTLLLMLAWRLRRRDV